MKKENIYEAVFILFIAWLVLFAGVNPVISPLFYGETAADVKSIFGQPGGCIAYDVMIKKGDPVEILGRKNGWMLIRRNYGLSAVQGWVKGDDVTRYEP